jgi:hypothetical protein
MHGGTGLYHFIELLVYLFGVQRNQLTCGDEEGRVVHFL